MVERERHARISSGMAGAAVRTDLDIIQDGLGHAFVDVSLSTPGIRETFLVDAGEALWFFEMLAGSGMLAAVPVGGGDVFAVQLPRPERAKEALAMIRKALDAVTGI